MATFSEHADVATSIDQAFDYVTDQRKVAEWNDHVRNLPAKQPTLWPKNDLSDEGGRNGAVTVHPKH
jgi:hypothetical protein